MTIIFVSDSSFLDGGISQVAIQSAIECVRQGHTLYYFAALGPPDPALVAALGSSHVRVLGSAEIKSDPNRLRAATSGIANFDAARALADLLKKFTPDDTVIHIHGWCKAVSALVFKTALNSGIPVICTIHEYFLACPNGAFYDYQKDEICHRKPLGFSCLTCNCDPRHYGHKLWRFTRGFVHTEFFGVPGKLPDVITLSPSNEKLIRPHLSPEVNCHRLHYPIFVTREARARAEHNTTYLFVGRFSREKGVLRFAEVARDLNLDATFVGDGHLRAELEKMVPHARFTGWLPQAGVLQEVRKARVVVFASTWYEGLGLVPIEAAAAGIPAVVSDCTVVTDFLQDGVSSLFFKYNSTEDLKRKLELCRSDATIEGLSRNAYANYWADPWTVEKHAHGLISIYQKISLTQRAPQKAVECVP